MNNRSLRKVLTLCATAAFSAGGLGLPHAAEKITVVDTDVLLVIDVQNCFLPGGSLAVAGGDQIVPLVNLLAAGFHNVVFTQDWHTADHVSFASQHPGRKPFDMIDLPYGRQMLWPDHCVQGTEGAALSKNLSIPHAQAIIRKGFHREVDSYSAFLEADRTAETGLRGYLESREIRRVFLVGLATDFCVAWSAIDARRFAFQVFVIEDATRGIDTNGSLAAAWNAMASAGVQRIQSSDLQLR
jgi:nicotinamidase/pyrazinamidase